MSVTISGASDDLIEIDGDLVEEFNYEHNHGDGDLLAFSCGVVLRITYTNAGVWRIVPVMGHADIVQAPESDDRVYSDVATIDDPVTWVVHGSGLAR
jgi:hypothetical protein